MVGKPSLRRRLILSYLLVVIAVVGAAFVTVQVLVPQFFEQAVQERLGPGPQDNQNQQQNQTDTPGPGPGNQGEQGNQGNQSDTTTTTGSSGTTQTTTTSAPTTTTGPAPTGSTMGPGGDDSGGGDGNPDPGNGENPDPGNSGGGSGSSDQGGGPGSGTGGNSTSTTIDAFVPVVPGIAAAAPVDEGTERSPVPIEIQQDYDRALTGALVVSTVIGLVIALVLGWWLTRRLLKAFTGIKDGASKLADGHYSVRVPVPPEVELADLAESVNTLADSLERTEQTRARLVSDLAHEIRNPLSTIEGYMEGLIDGVLPPSRDTYEAVAAEAHRLKRLTMDLSTLSKAQEGAIEYDFSVSNLAEVAERVAETLRPQYEINNVALSFSIPDTMPVRIDTDRVAQALTNLLGNALSHTPEGGAVEVLGTSDYRWCSIKITDTGSGIPDTQLETIFERFTRLGAGHAGTGIGLNIARTLARAHGGDITASSAGIGEGSTFELILPRAVS